MNETMSLVLATTILAIGGLGFYMYNTSDKNPYNDYDTEGSMSDSDMSDSDSDSSDEDLDYLDLDDVDEDEKPKVKSRNKTKKNKKTTGGSKRRY